VNDVPVTERRGVQVRITRIEDVEPQKVRTQRHADGSQRSVWDRYFVISRDPKFVSLHTWEPEVVVHRHGHMGHHVVYVLRGGMIGAAEVLRQASFTGIGLPLAARDVPSRRDVHQFDPDPVGVGQEDDLDNGRVTGANAGRWNDVTAVVLQPSGSRVDVVDFE